MPQHRKAATIVRSLATPRRCMKDSHTAAAALATLLVVATGVLLQFCGSKPPPPGEDDMRWKRKIPEAIAGWETRDEPLGETEYQQQEVLRALQLEHFVHREYHKGARTVSVFVAWWPPGRIPTRLVAFHSPDICWTAQGMRCTAFVNRRQVSVGGRIWHPAEWRTFVDGNGDTFQVLFWLLIGGQPYDFGTGLGRLPSPWAWFDDLRKRLAGERQDHLLVRIATNGTWEECLSDPALAKALEDIDSIGLRQRTP